jgi:hypothetical protein
LIVPLFFQLTSSSQIASKSYGDIKSVIQLSANIEKPWPGRTFNTDLTWKSKSEWKLESLDLAIGTYFKRPILLRAEIRSSTCTLRAPWWSSLIDNMYLRFDAVGPCVLKPDDVMQVSVRTLKAPALAVMQVSGESDPTLASADGSNHGLAIMSFIQGAPVGQGEPPRMSRLEALAKFWNLSPELYFSVALLAVLLVLGSLALIFHGSPRSPPACVTMLFAGVCLYYAVISPPLQGPDEATHFNSYLALTGQSQKISDAKSWASRIHYPRINCQVNACISAEDMRKPTELSSPHYVYTLDIRERSAIGATGLDWLGRVFDVLPIERQLLGLRLSNVVCGSLFLLLSLLIFYPGGLTPRLSFDFMGTWLAIPTLGFLSMNANNHGLTINSYTCLLIGCLAALTNKNPHRLGQFAWAGVLGLWAALSGRTGIAGGALLIGTYYLTASVRSKSYRDWMLGTLALGSVMSLGFYLYKDSIYLANQLPGVQHRINVISGQIGVSPESVYLSLILGVLFGILTLRTLAKHLSLKSNSFPSTSRKAYIMKVMASVIVSVFLILLIWPLTMDTAAVPDIEFTNHGLTRLQFIGAVLKSFWLNLGIHGQDFFIQSSLWAGFGCPDRALPNIFLQILKSSLLLGIGAGLAKGYWLRDYKEIILRSLSVGLITIWMVIMSAVLLPGDYVGGVNPHGRFLIGSALIGGFLGVSGWHLAIDEKQKFSYGFYVTIIFAFIGMGAGSWSWLDRFFR